MSIEWKFVTDCRCSVDRFFCWWVSGSRSYLLTEGAAHICHLQYMNNTVFWCQMAERLELFTCGICRHSSLHGVEKKSKSQQDLLLHLFQYVFPCDSVLVRTGTMPTSNSGELLQRSEHVLIFIKVSKGCILTVIYVLASASFSLRIDLIQWSLPICKVFCTQLFLKTCSKIFSLSLGCWALHWLCP